MKKIDLICVGKLKDNHLESIENDFLKRINFVDFRIHEVKALADSPDQEAKNIIKKLDELQKSGKALLVLMTEFGKTFHSPGFAEFLKTNLETTSNLIFVIAGATGFGKKVLELPHKKLSLSPMTFPHKMARIILVEQIYRGQSILSGHPYHN